MNKFPELAQELFEPLVELINLKENNGARDDHTRNDCLDLLLQLLRQGKDNKILNEKIVHNSKNIKTLYIAILVNHEKLQKKKMSMFAKYSEILIHIIGSLNKTLENKELEQAYKTKITQNVKINIKKIKFNI